MGVVYRRVFPNEKCYIGKTIQEPIKRWRREDYEAKIEKDTSPKLMRALRKYD